MLSEVVGALRPRPGGRYVDCTLGTGGHAEAILAASKPSGQLLGLEADPEALARARARLALYQKNLELVQESFQNLEQVSAQKGFRLVDGILFDLGLSSLQLQSGRGFSFREDAPLDMRFDPSEALTASQVVNGYPEERLVQIFTTYGQERRARRIARAIVDQRPVYSSLELAELVSRVVGTAGGRIHPATRVFQSIRMEVNNELGNLETALYQAIKLLGPEGRLVVISYHSGEDRVVKRVFQRAMSQCICPPEIPMCQCGHQPELRRVGSKLLRPSQEEITTNLRSRSARLRVAEHCQQDQKSCYPIQAREGLRGR